MKKRLRYLSLVFWLCSASLIPQLTYSQPQSIDDEVNLWKEAEDRMQNTFRIAVELLDAPHTKAIKEALERSQKDWLRYRETHCTLQATVQSFGSKLDERHMASCRAKEAVSRARYIQYLVP